MAIDQIAAPATPQPNVVEEQLYCALTGQPITADKAYWAPPLVTARELVTTIVSAALTSPGTLSHILFDEQPNVPYAPQAREQLAARRSTEQLKLLVGLLVVVALIVAPIVLLAMR